MKKLRLAVIPKSVGNEFWETVQAGSAAAAKELDVEMFWEGTTTETETARQIAIVDGMISQEVDGMRQRRLRICGTEGSIDLCPLERLDGGVLQLQLRLRNGNAEYAAGTHTVEFGVQEDRYAGQLVELAQMIRGEIRNPYTCEHDCLVQEVTLAASGYTRWE